MDKGQGQRREIKGVGQRMTGKIGEKGERIASRMEVRCLPTLRS